MSDSEKPRASPDLPWKTRIFMSAMAFAVDVSCRRDLTVNRRLFNLIDIKCSPSNDPRNGVKSSDVVVDSSRNLWFRLYTPTNSPTPNGSLPVVVFFHGGGFALMAANSKPFDEFCQRLARELPAVVISVNYRLAPEHRYPSQYDDGIDVLKFIDSSDAELLPPSADLERCFLAGDSAGGNLAHHVAVLASEHDFSKLKLAGLIAIQPFFGGEERTESEISLPAAPLVSMERADWMWKAFLPEGSNRDHAAANVFGPNAVNISSLKFPATAVFVGGFDPLQDWQRRYYEGLKKCGKEAYLIECPSAVHGYYIFPELPESSFFIEEARDFIRSH